jgi:hypothetical protein
VYRNVLDGCPRKKNIEIELPETIGWDVSSDQGLVLTFNLAMRKGSLSLHMYDISSMSVLTREGWWVG